MFCVDSCKVQEQSDDAAAPEHLESRYPVHKNEEMKMLQMLMLRSHNAKSSNVKRNGEIWGRKYGEIEEESMEGHADMAPVKNDHD